MQGAQQCFAKEKEIEALQSLKLPTLFFKQTFCVSFRADSSRQVPVVNLNSLSYKKLGTSNRFVARSYQEIVRASNGRVQSSTWAFFVTRRSLLSSESAGGRNHWNMTQLGNISSSNNRQPIRILHVPCAMFVLN